MSEAIAAFSGGALPAAIGIVRLSGTDAIGILSKIFTPIGKKMITDCNKNTMIYGKLLDIDKNVVDICLAVFYIAPHSYTGEDMAEVFTHGSQAIVSAALEHAFKIGARPAEAGEFTRRAFLNGKLDLSEAEAVADLIYSKSRHAAANAVALLEGGTSEKIAPMREEVLSLLSHFYAVCDYTDEDIEPFEYANAAAALQKNAALLRELYHGYKRGSVIREGLPVAIIGRPNAGKSSLFNCLAGQDRAIVTSEAGTTRDVLDYVIDINGALFRILDTAGLRRGEGLAESMGIEKSLKTALEAQAVICVFDGSVPPQEDDLRAIEAAVGKPSVAVLNKSDLGRADFGDSLSGFSEVISLSTVDLSGIDRLESWLSALAPAPDGAYITSPRQAELLRRAAELLSSAADCATLGMTADAFLADAESAVRLLGEITGHEASADIAGAIFSRFCVGK